MKIKISDSQTISQFGKTITSAFAMIFLMGSFGMVNAQEKPIPTIDPYELSLEQLGKIVITASKTPQSTNKVTQKVDVVPEKLIKKIVQSNRNVAELIQYIPGAAVKVLSRNDANWGAYGGIGPKYNTFMLQGLPIDGFMDPMNLEMMAVQRIEIQRGPASVLYPNYLSQDFAGNQSPLAGTVNLILKENIVLPQSLGSFSLGSFNTFTGKVYHENRIGELQFFAGGSYEKSDYTNYGSTGSWLNMLKNPQYQKGKAILGASVFLDKAEKHKISVFSNLTFHKGDVGRVNREFDNDYGLYNLSYSGQLADSLNIAFKVGLRNYKRTWQEDNFNSNNDQSLRETDGVKQTIIPVDLSISRHHFKTGILTAGADYQRASYLTTTQPVNLAKATGNDAFVSQAGLYFQEELQLQKLTVRGGARFNRIDYNINKLSGTAPGIETQSWNIVLWSAGARFRFADEWSVFANAGNGFMPPGLKSIGGTLSINDKFVPGKNGQLPNPDLKPEKGVGFDLGIDGKLLSTIDFSFRTFNSKIIDAIIDNVVSNNPSQTMSGNADGKTQAKGFEVCFKQSVGNVVEWVANLTYSDSKITDPNNPDQDGVDIPFVPKVMGNLGFSVFLPKSIEVCPWVHFGGRIYDSSSRATRQEFNSKELINIYASKTIKMVDRQNLVLFLKLYNVINNKFDMPWQFRDPGFTYTLGARYSF